jgi:hypothetical protein
VFSVGDTASKLVLVAAPAVVTVWTGVEPALQVPAVVENSPAK